MFLNSEKSFVILSFDFTLKIPRNYERDKFANISHEGDDEQGKNSLQCRSKS